MSEKPPYELPFEEPPAGDGGEKTFFPPHAQPFPHGPGQLEVPNAVAVLVLGILSLLFSLCYGLGILLSIVALVLAGPGRRNYRRNPDAYSRASWQMLKAGRICAFVSLGLVIILLGIFVVTLIFGILSKSDPTYY